MSIDKEMEEDEIAAVIGAGEPMLPATMEPRWSDLGLVLDEATLAKVRKVVTDGTPVNTRRAYAADLRFFAGWLRASGFDEAWPVPPEVMVRFVVEQVEGMPPEVDESLVAEGLKKDLGTQAWPTAERRVAAVATAHRTRGLPSPMAHPVVMEIVGRARRASVTRGWSPRRKASADREILEKLLATCDDDVAGIRDRAILLFGFSTGGRRRSEISEATFERLQQVGRQYVYRMGRTKTEQEGGDRPVPLTGRTAEAMARWLALSGIQEGALFRVMTKKGVVSPEGVDPRTVARMIKRRALAAGLDPEAFGGHSLRAGFMTEAGARRISMIEAMSLSGHKDVNTAAVYYRAGEVLSVDAGRMMEGAHPGREAAADDLVGIVDAAVEMAAADAGVGDDSERNETASAPDPMEVDAEIVIDDFDAGETLEKVIEVSVSGPGVETEKIEEEKAEAVPAPRSEEAVEKDSSGNVETAHPELAAFRPSFLWD